MHVLIEYIRALLIWRLCSVYPREHGWNTRAFVSSRRSACQYRKIRCGTWGVKRTQPESTRSTMVKRWFLLVSVASHLAATPAVAHDWYPIECCHGLDCAPVERVEVLPNAAAMAVTSKHGTAIVPVSFPTRDSKDHRMHVCMRPSGAGAMHPVCLFLPPSS